MFNRVILIGNLTRKPELRMTGGGTPVATLTLAVNSRYTQGGESKEETLFMDCTVFGKQAETVEQYLDKGRSVLVEGRLQEQRWEREGVKHSKMVVIANNVRFLGGGKSQGDGGKSSVVNTDPIPYSGDEPF